MISYLSIVSFFGFFFPRIDIHMCHCTSASQIRASCVLWTIGIPARFVSIVYCVTRYQGTTSRSKFAAVEGY
jgi:hypothetical protein